MPFCICNFDELPCLLREFMNGVIRQYVVLHGNVCVFVGVAYILTEEAGITDDLSVLQVAPYVLPDALFAYMSVFSSFWF